MDQSEAEKELNESLLKCRCCFRMMIDDLETVEIDEDIQSHFFTLTQIELLMTDYFSSRICQSCAKDLKKFSILRRDLISKQSSLYQLANVEPHPVAQKEEEEEAVDVYESMDYETIPYDANQVIEEEIFLEEVNENDFDKSTLKIEKLSNSQIVFNESETIEYYNDDNNEDDDSKTIESVVSISKEYEEEEVEVECEECGILVDVQHVDQHIDIMHSKKPMKCEKCSKTFHSRISLRRHLNEDHIVGTKRTQKMKKKLFYCSLCTKEYDYQKKLTDHMRSFHKKERNTECQICHRWFYHRDIRKHIQHVHGEKRIACEQCGKLYTCLENLKLHMRYHQMPKYVCEFENCGKKFHQKTLYEHHIVKHSAEKLIECNECGSFFYTLRDLKRHHQRIHAKVKRKCFGCEQQFCRKDKYREHVLKQHKELSEDERQVILEEIRQLKWYENVQNDSTE